MKIFIDRGADVTFADQENGNSILHIAVGTEDVKFIDLVLNRASKLIAND